MDFNTLLTDPILTPYYLMFYLYVSRFFCTLSCPILIDLPTVSYWTQLRGHQMEALANHIVYWFLIKINNIIAFYPLTMDLQVLKVLISQ